MQFFQYTQTNILHAIQQLRAHHAIWMCTRHTNQSVYAYLRCARVFTRFFHPGSYVSSKNFLCILVPSLSALILPLSMFFIAFMKYVHVWGSRYEVHSLNFVHQTRCNWSSTERVENGHEGKFYSVDDEFEVVYAIGVKEELFCIKDLLPNNSTPVTRIKKKNKQKNPSESSFMHQIPSIYQVSILSS